MRSYAGRIRDGSSKSKTETNGDGDRLLRFRPAGRWASTMLANPQNLAFFDVVEMKPILLDAIVFDPGN